jgi:hypothetical protein
MTKLYVSDVEIVETDLYERMAEDGAIIVYDCFVRVYCDGMVYDHEHVFKGAYKDQYEGYYHVNYNCRKEAEKLANRVAEAGQINTDHWNEIGHVDEIFKTQEERLEEAWSCAEDFIERY